MKCRPRRNRYLVSPRHSPIRQLGDNFAVAVADFGRHSLRKIVASPNRATFHLSPSPISAAIHLVKMLPRRYRRRFICRHSPSSRNRRRIFCRRRRLRRKRGRSGVWSWDYDLYRLMVFLRTYIRSWSRDHDFLCFEIMGYWKSQDHDHGIMRMNHEGS